MPSLIGFIGLFLYPFVMSFIYSLQYSRFNHSFVGLKNYVELFQTEAFRLALKNTSVFMGVGIPLVIVLSYIMAYAIHIYKPPTWVKVALILPIAIPSATVVPFFRGVFGTLLDTQFAMGGVWLIYIWRSIGYNLIIYIAAFDLMDQGPIEAAMIDGANTLLIHRHVIVPLTTAATQFVAILSVMNAFKVFKDVYILEGNYPNQNIYMLQHFMNNTYRKIQYERLSSAAFTLLLIIVMIIGLIYLRRVKLWRKK